MYFLEHSQNDFMGNFGFTHRVSIERKCPCIEKLKGEGNFPSYFDNDDVIYIEMPNFGYDIGQEGI